MASGIGFVYLLGNVYMKDVYKIGYTDRSPHARAEELSSSTSCPFPFDVILFIETEAAREVERQFHESFDHHRIQSTREFFHVIKDDLVEIWSAFFDYPNRLSTGKGAQYAHYFEPISKAPHRNVYLKPKNASEKPEEVKCGGLE